MYELSITLRTFFGVTGTEVGYSYYIITMIFETIIGVFFIVFAENNPRLTLKMKVQ